MDKEMDTIDRLTAELEEYKSTELTANEYRESVGFVLSLNKAVKQATGKTALDWEKLISENAQLTARLAAAVERCNELEESLLDMTVQFSSRGGKMRHAFMSAEEQAYSVLDINYGEDAGELYARFEKKWRGEESE